MTRLIIKIGGYSVIIYLFSLMGCFGEVTIKTAVILGLILTGVNTFIRPILVLIALPFNLLTFGITSVFANLLSLVIANAIIGGLLSGFWWMLLLSLIIMLFDDAVRESRYRIKSSRLAEK
jgi:putative membrane protein